MPCQEETSGLIRELRRNGLTRNPMAMAIVVAFVGVVGRLALSMTGLEKTTAAAPVSIAYLGEGQAEPSADVVT